MTVRIELNDEYSGFAGYDLAHVSVVVGNTNVQSMFVNYETRNRHLKNVGRAGYNQQLMVVGGNYPIRIEDRDFTLLGSEVPDLDSFQANRIIAPLVDYMRRGLLKVFQDDTELTPEQVIDYQSP